MPLSGLLCVVLASAVGVTGVSRRQAGGGELRFGGCCGRRRTGCQQSKAMWLPGGRRGGVRGWRRWPSPSAIRMDLPAGRKFAPASRHQLPALRVPVMEHFCPSWLDELQAGQRLVSAIDGNLPGARPSLPFLH